MDIWFKLYKISSVVSMDLQAQPLKTTFEEYYAKKGWDKYKRKPFVSSKLAV